MTGHCIFLHTITQIAGRVTVRPFLWRSPFFVTAIVCHAKVWLVDRDGSTSVQASKKTWLRLIPSGEHHRVPWLHWSPIVDQSPTAIYLQLMLQCRRSELGQPPLLFCSILGSSMSFRQLLGLLLISASKSDTRLYSPTFVSTRNQSMPCTLAHLHVLSWRGVS